MNIKLEDGTIVDVITHNESDAIESGGTWLQGHISATYARLVSLFGKPLRRRGDKVQAEWELDFEGTIITIYDYKNYDVAPENNTSWHIGGFGGEALRAVKILLKGTVGV